MKPTNPRDSLCWVRDAGNPHTDSGLSNTLALKSCPRFVVESSAIRFGRSTIWERGRFLRTGLPFIGEASRPGGQQQ